jgi:hypothetical protein
MKGQPLDLLAVVAQYPGLEFVDRQERDILRAPDQSVVSHRPPEDTCGGPRDIDPVRADCLTGHAAPDLANDEVLATTLADVIVGAVFPRSQ